MRGDQCPFDHGVDPVVLEDPLPHMMPIVPSYLPPPGPPAGPQLSQPPPPIPAGPPIQQLRHAPARPPPIHTGECSPNKQLLKFFSCVISPRA